MLTTLVILILILITLYFVYILNRLPRSPDASHFARKIILHRARCENFPDNTLEAISIADKNQAVRIIEIDVLLTADDVLVVFHDHNLERSTKLNKNLASCTYDEIKHLTIKDSSCAIPRLEEALEALKDSSLKIVLDVRTSKKSREIARQITQLIKKYDLYFRVCLSSFYPLFLYRLRKIEPKILTTLAFKPCWRKSYIENKIYYASMNTWLPFLLRVGMVALHKDTVCKHIVKKWEKKGIDVSAWTINNKCQKHFLREIVDCSIITDNVSLDITTEDEPSLLLEIDYNVTA